MATLPQGLKSIPEGAFMGCRFSGGLENMVIPEGVTVIGKDAFNGCYNLTEVVIPEGVTPLGSRPSTTATLLARYPYRIA